jgi:hypothetical protein
MKVTDSLRTEFLSDDLQEGAMVVQHCLAALLQFTALRRPRLGSPHHLLEELDERQSRGQETISGCDCRTSSHHVDFDSRIDQLFVSCHERSGVDRVWLLRRSGDGIGECSNKVITGVPSNTQ